MIKTTHLCRGLTVALMASLAGCSVWDVPPQKATPQRPTFSSDTSTTAPGTLELEAGGENDPGDSWQTPTTLKWGMSENAELFATWQPYQVVRQPGPDADGVGDLFLGMRYRFLEDEGVVPSAALQLSTKLPTGDDDDGLSSGETDFFASAILTKQIGSVAMTLYYEAGILGEPNDTSHDLSNLFAAAASAPLTERLGVFGELAGNVISDQDIDDYNTTWGLTWSVSESFVLDVGVRVGLSDDADDFVVLFGLTKNFGGPGLPK